MFKGMDVRMKPFQKNYLAEKLERITRHDKQEAQSNLMKTLEGIKFDKLARKTEFHSTNGPSWDL
jgi:hypothetical protein